MFKSAVSLYRGDIVRMTADFLHSNLLAIPTPHRNYNFIENCINGFISEDNKELCIGWIFIIAFEKSIFYLNTVQYDKYQEEINFLSQFSEKYIDIR